MDLTLRTDLDEYIKTLTNALNKLRTTLLLEDVISLHETYTVKKEKNNRYINLNNCKELAVNCYLDIHCNSPLDTKDVALYPGFIQVNKDVTATQQLSEAVDCVNKAKTNLKFFLDLYNKPKEIVLATGPKVVVNPILFEAYPMINPSQLFRKITILDESVDKLRFKWNRKQRYDKLTIAEAKNIVLYNIDKPPSIDYSKAQWSNILNRLRERIERLPSNLVLTRIRPTPFSPQVTVKHNHKKAWDKYHGSIPLLINTPLNKEIVITSHLESLNEAQPIDFSKLESLGWNVVSKELGLYFR